MRTIVTLDEDVDVDLEWKVRGDMHRSRVRFKPALNPAIRLSSA